MQLIKIYSFSSNRPFFTIMFTYDGDTIQAYRSPYRLYRPYQFEVPQQATIPSNSTALYRTPNLDILSEINRRSRRLERIVAYQKILTVTQVFSFLFKFF